MQPGFASRWALGEPLDGRLLDDGFPHLGKADLIEAIGYLNQRRFPVIGIVALSIRFMQVEEVLNGPKDA